MPEPQIRPSAMRSVIRKFREGSADRNGGRANQSLPMKNFKLVMDFFHRAEALPHVVESIQRVVRARTRTIDTGVTNSACNETTSKARTSPRVAEILCQVRGARNGGRQNESYRHSDVGL